MYIKYAKLRIILWHYLVFLRLIVDTRSACENTVSTIRQAMFPQLSISSEAISQLLHRVKLCYLWETPTQKTTILKLFTLFCKEHFVGIQSEKKLTGVLLFLLPETIEVYWTVIRWLTSCKSYERLALTLTIVTKS